MTLHDDAERLATIIRDYREGEVPRPDAAHVLRWIEQFPALVREPLLAETTHVLERTYVARATMIAFLRDVATSPKLVGADPAAFWRSVTFLRVQKGGTSQRDMLDLFDAVLHELYGFTTAACGGNGPHIYLDDGIFSGGRIAADLMAWVRGAAPARADVAVIVIALHRYGRYNADNRIAAAAREAGKRVALTWWRLYEPEDRRAYTANSDVLRPTAVPAEAAAYARALKFPPVVRTGARVGELGLYSSAANRELLEQEFLKGGIDVLDRCRQLREKPAMRPLGAMTLETLGFGTMFVTYRNVPNNAPLVLWAGDPWYPLFRRKINVK